MKGAALFSGGKDSLYALYLAEKQGVKVNDLITLLPTLPWPSPHAENISALKLIAKSMNKKLTIVDFRKESKFIDILGKLEIDVLIAGDVNVEAHLKGLQDVCNRVGIQLLEPIYGRDTLDLFSEIFGIGFKALITGISLKYLEKDLLGFVISKKTSEDFLMKIGTIDPLGENGEYHTLVLESPLYSKSFKTKSFEEKLGKEMAYLHVDLVYV